MKHDGYRYRGGSSQATKISHARWGAWCVDQVGAGAIRFAWMAREKE